ncbi:MAG: FhaA domain-containing protein [Actinomycetota bacterium]
MGMFDRFEKGIERAVNGAFAKAFRAEVQPVEIASALRKTADERVAVVSSGRALAPNVFVVELGATDYDRLIDYADELGKEFAVNLEEHAQQQGYAFVGPVTVTFVEVPELDTGVFRVQASTLRGHGSDVEPKHHAPVPAAASFFPERSPEFPPASLSDELFRQQEPIHQIVPEVAPAAPSPFERPQPPVPDAAAYLNPGVPAGFPAQSVPAPPQLEESRTYEPPAAHHFSAPYDNYSAQERQSTHLPESPTPPIAPPPSRPWLEINGQAYPLLTGSTVIGRGDEAGIVVDDLGVSRAHAEIRVSADGPHLLTTIRDLNSTNGTFVNAQRITATHLTEGASITLGRMRAVYREPR